MDDRPPSPPKNSLFHVISVPSSSKPGETYAVHVPRDQVHSVPPLEHERIIDEYRRSLHDPAAAAGRRKYVQLGVFVLGVTVLFLFILGILRCTIYNAIPPHFSIQEIRTQNLLTYLKKGSPMPSFIVTLRAKNSKPRMGVSYKGGLPTSLTMEALYVGKGKFPLKSKKSGDHKDFQVVVTGKPDSELEESLDDPDLKHMVLRTEIPVKMSSWAKTKKWSLSLDCAFKVKHSLVGKGKNAPKVVYQDCQTEDLLSK